MHLIGLEQVDGMPALDMELVEGPTLADHLAAVALPVEECLTIARQLAEALEVAHEKGIVHRDPKPANVKLAADGRGAPRAALRDNRACDGQRDVTAGG